MDELLVAVLLRHLPLTTPDHLVELLLCAMQRQAVELTVQRSCGSFYRRVFSLFLSDLFSPFFVYGSFVCLVVLAVGVFFGAFYIGRLLFSFCLSACVRRPRLNELQMQCLPWTLSIYLCPSVWLHV